MAGRRCGSASWPTPITPVKDDLAQPIRWEAGAQFAELNYRIARNMADADQRPMWYAGDYFGETFAPSQPKAKRQVGSKP